MCRDVGLGWSKTVAHSAFLSGSQFVQVAHVTSTFYTVRPERAYVPSFGVCGMPEVRHDGCNRHTQRDERIGLPGP